MTTLMPRGYGGFPLYQFNPPKPSYGRYYNGGYARQGPAFAPHYPSQPLYQPPFNPVEGYPVSRMNQSRQPGMGTQMLMLYNKLDAQYRQEQHARDLRKLQKQYWKVQDYNIPPPMYSAPPPPAFYDPETVYQYEKVTKYVPFPVYITPGMRSYGASGNLGYLGGSNAAFGSGGGMSLPPKIRVIFIPNGQSFAQQPYTGSLVSHSLNTRSRP